MAKINLKGILFPKWYLATGTGYMHALFIVAHVIVFLMILVTDLWGIGVLLYFITVPLHVIVYFVLKRRTTNQQQVVQVELKDTASGGFCGKCGSELISGKDFCGNCGAKVFIKTCEKCGSELISGKDFCVDCGVQISSEEIPS